MLSELEGKTEEHIAELNKVHDHYRSMQVENTQLRELQKMHDEEIERI